MSFTHKTNLPSMLNLSSSAIEAEDIIHYLKTSFQFQKTCQRVLCQRLIRQVAEAKSVSVSDEEIQMEGDRWRYEHRLEKATDTLAWLADQMLSIDDLETAIRDRLLEQKLARSLFEKAAETFFYDHRLDFDQIVLYQLLVAEHALAKELAFQIEEDEISFFAAAHHHDVNEQRRQTCGYEGTFYRWSLPPDISALVFSAQPDDLLGPLKTDQGYYLFRVDCVIPAQLTPTLHQSIIDQHFQTWLQNEIDLQFFS